MESERERQVEIDIVLEREREKERKEEDLRKKHRKNLLKRPLCLLTAGRKSLDENTHYV